MLGCRVWPRNALSFAYESVRLVLRQASRLQRFPGDPVARAGRVLRAPAMAQPGLRLCRHTHSRLADRPGPHSAPAPARTTRGYALALPRTASLRRDVACHAPLGDGCPRG